jgi:hypothetical protein
MPIPFETIFATLDRFASESINPPTVKDFIFSAPKGTIPTVPEKKMIVYSDWVPCKHEKVEQYLMNIREKLSIAR